MKNRIFSSIPSFNRLLLTTATLLTAWVGQAAAQGLSLQFADQSASFDPSQVWITFDNGGSANAFDVTYNNGTQVTIASGNHLSSSIQLSTVTDSTFTVNSVSSVAVFVSYGSGFTTLTSSPSFFSNGVSADVVYQNFEMTRTGGAGDQGNLTNINYFTAPMSISSYSGSYHSGTTALQSTGFNQSTVSIANQLAALTPSGSNAVVMGGQLKRYVGPSTWTTNPPYQSFVPYLKSVNASGVTNKIVNSNAFNTNGSNGTDGSNYNFTLNLQSSVGTDGTITLSGSITTQVKDNATGTFSTGPTFSNANIVLSGTDPAALNSIIYGQTDGQFPSDVTWGTGWSDFDAFINNTANDLTDSGAYATTQALAMGEITSAVLMGFLGNTTEVGGVALNTMESNEWWNLDPFQAFGQIQSNSANYNDWANVIYSASNNGVYSIPYSDRLGVGPLVNSVQFSVSGTSYNVDKWVVGYGDPVSVVPEPGAITLALLGGASLVFLRRRVGQGLGPRGAQRRAM